MPNAAVTWVQRQAERVFGMVAPAELRLMPLMPVSAWQKLPAQKQVQPEAALALLRAVPEV